MYCSPVYINPIKYLDTFADSTDDGKAKSFKLELVYGITYAENVNNKFLINVECNPAGWIRSSASVPTIPHPSCDLSDIQKG